MNSKNLMHYLIALIAIVKIATPSYAAQFDLVAKKFTTVMPDGATINMWGFALDTGQLCTEDPGWDVGPKLLVNPGEALTVNLRNCLADPVSIVIPGQPMPVVSTGSGPVRHNSGPFAGRVRSFTGEAAPNGGTATYSWLNLNPGTYVYHSGTQPQIQVQMGLYGPASKDAAAGEAYNGIAYDEQLDLLYSEIDPALHSAVANGTYGTTGPTSTLDYQPKYFLINGEPYTSSSPCAFADGSLLITESLLIRFMNNGLREFAPMMIGSHFQVVAEAGNKYQFPYSQYSLLLQPGSTKDVLFTPATPGNYPIVDRRLNLTNNTATGGGMQTCISVLGPPVNHPPIITSTAITIGTLSLYTYDVEASDPNLGDTLTFSLDLAPQGMVIDPTSGLIQWTPQSNQTGDNNVTVRVTDEGGMFATQSFTITVSSIPAPLLYFSTAGKTAIPGVASPYDDADIYSWDGTSFTRIFDASNAGLRSAADIDAFKIVGDLIYMSFNRNTGVEVPGLGLVQDEDIVVYNQTSHSWTMYFDGSDVGLHSSDDKDVDAFEILSDGSLILSIVGTGTVAGIASVQDEDLLSCVGTFGPITSCSWSVFFDGSDIELTGRAEDIDNVAVSSGRLYLSTSGKFSVPGLSGGKDDIFVCESPTLGDATSCSAFTIYFKANALGIYKIDAIDVP